MSLKEIIGQVEKDRRDKKTKTWSIEKSTENYQRFQELFSRERIRELTGEDFYAPGSGREDTLHRFIEIRVKVGEHTVNMIPGAIGSYGPQPFESMKGNPEGVKEMLLVLSDTGRSLSERLSEAWDIASKALPHVGRIIPVKLASAYDPDNVLNIFKLEDLEDFADMLGIKRPANYDALSDGGKYEILNAELIRFKNKDEVMRNWPVAVFTHMYYGYLKENPTKTPSGATVELAHHLASSGLLFPPHLPPAFWNALRTKGFVFLAGLTGTGKTKLAMEVAEALSFLPCSIPRDIQWLGFFYGKSGSKEEELQGVEDAPYNPEAEVTRLYDHEKPNDGLTYKVPQELREDIKKNGVVLFLYAGKSSNYPEEMAGKFIGAWWLKDVQLTNEGQIEKGKIVQRWRFKTPIEPEFLTEEEISGSAQRNPNASFWVLKKCGAFLFISVRPDWTDKTELLGWVNPLAREGESRYKKGLVLDFLLRAVEDYEKNKGNAGPYFLILDEMNLAHIEYYFADFLSVLESGRDEDGWTKEAIKLHEDDEIEKNEHIPKEIKLPPNLYIIGTLNTDETTKSLSPKVLDRGFVLEFGEVDMEGYPPKSNGNEDDRKLKDLMLKELSEPLGFWPEITLPWFAQKEGTANDAKEQHENSLKQLFDQIRKYGFTVIPWTYTLSKEQKDNRFILVGFVGGQGEYRLFGVFRVIKAEEDEKRLMEYIKHIAPDKAEELLKEIDGADQNSKYLIVDRIWFKSFNHNEWPVIKPKEDPVLPVNTKELGQTGNYGRTNSNYISLDPAKAREWLIKNKVIPKVILCFLSHVGNKGLLNKNVEDFRGPKDNPTDQWKHLIALNSLLKPHELHFGYRVIDEIALFVLAARDSEVAGLGLEEAFDLAVCSKVLPKFYGTRARLEKPLWKVIKWAGVPFNPESGKELETIEGFIGKLEEQIKSKNQQNSKTEERPPEAGDTGNTEGETPAPAEPGAQANEISYPHTALKALRMLRGLYEEGFASYL